ncbi:MAG TPA: toxic anion resistance protein [Campylobacterales bacterium]|nr:toxic anion resistance protein [Campylobacterales bacterium]
MDKQIEENQQAIKKMAIELEAEVKDVAVDALDDASKDVVKYDDASIKEQTKIELIAKEIKIQDSHSVIFFGSKAQEQINSVSDSMLERVRNKDLGSSGDGLNALVTAIKGFDVDALNPNVKQGFFSKLFGFASPAVKFLGKYEDVRGQVDRITDDLEQHKTQLLTDITALDRLYDVNFDYFNDLELYIAAGVYKLNELDTNIIPKLQEEAGSSKKLASKLGLNNIVSTRNDLERRVHDLRLTRQVAMQALPSIKMVQENDKNLISKINSTLVNTVPLWKNQLAQTITIYRSAEAAKSVKNATDLTNDLLQENAKNLKEANAAVRTEVERGVYDIKSIKMANQTLIDTLAESLEISQKGKETRAAAEAELLEIEAQLQDALLAASKKRN